MKLKQRSTGWAIHLGVPNLEQPRRIDWWGNKTHSDGLMGNGGMAHIFRTRNAARKELGKLKPLETWPWPRARVVPVDIRIEART